MLGQESDSRVPSTWETLTRPQRAGRLASSGRRLKAGPEQCWPKAPARPAGGQRRQTRRLQPEGQTSMGLWKMQQLWGKSLTIHGVCIQFWGVCVCVCG